MTMKTLMTEDQQEWADLMVDLEIMRDALQWLYAAAALKQDPLQLLREHQVSAETFQKSLPRDKLPLKLIQESGQTYQRRLSKFRRGVESRMKLAISKHVGK